MIVILAGNLPTWERVNKVIDKLMPIIKSLNIETFKSTKIVASLEGYIKTILKENKIIKEEFRW